MTALETAQLYFDLSNKSDLGAVENLFTGSTTYISQTTGTYSGTEEIMAMQRAFHAKFSSLHWHLNSAQEVQPGVVLFDYDFTGKLPSGEEVRSTGLEYVTIKNGRIMRVEIKSKH